MDTTERARLAGAVSVLVDIERDPIHKKQLVDLMNSLQSNAKLNKNEEALIEKIDIFTTLYA